MSVNWNVGRSSISGLQIASGGSTTTQAKGKEKLDSSTDTTVSIGDSQGRSRPNSTILMSSGRSQSFTASAAGGSSSASASTRARADAGTSLNKAMRNHLGAMVDLNNKLDNLPEGGSLRKAVDHGIEALSQAQELLSVSPGGAEGTEAHLTDLRSLSAEIDDAISTLDDHAGGSDVAQEMRSLLGGAATSLKTVIKEHEAFAQKVVDDNPVSEKRIFFVKSAWAEGAEMLLSQEMAKLGPDREDDIAVLKQALTAVSEHRKDLDETGHEGSLSKSQISDRMGNPAHGIKAKLPLIGKIFVQHQASREKAAAKELMEGVTFKDGGRACTIPRWSPKIREEAMLKSVVETALKNANVSGKRDISFELTHCRQQVLNNRKWDVQAEKIPIKYGDEQFTLGSIITPQSSLGKTYEGMHGGGVNCHMSRYHKGCANLARTEVQMDGKTLFSGLRHGVLSAYDIRDKVLKKVGDEELQEMVTDLLGKDERGNAVDEQDRTYDPGTVLRAIRKGGSDATAMAKVLRETAADRRAYDLAKAALVSDGAQLTRAIKDGKIDLTINSIGLLTPSKLMGGGKEIQMVKDQTDALRRLGARGEPVVIDIVDEQGNKHEIDVTVKTRAFNFGVNDLAIGNFAFDGSEGRLANLANGWRNCRPHNDAAMDGLIGSRSDRRDDGGQIGGDVAAWLNDKNNIAGAEVKAQVAELAGQIASIYDSSTYRTAGKEPYKLVSRLAMLSHLMGETSCFNCKSGKDRTGVMDTEVKYLASQMHLTGDVPSPDVGRSEAEAANANRIMVGGGSMGLQLMNTAAAGYKLDLEVLAEGIGGRAQYNANKGAGSTVGS